MGSALAKLLISACLQNQCPCFVALGASFFLFFRVEGGIIAKPIFPFYYLHRMSRSWQKQICTINLFGTYYALLDGHALALDATSHFPRVCILLGRTQSNGRQ